MKDSEFLAEMKGLEAPELQARASKLAEELMKFRFKKASGQLENPHRIKAAKRNLARVMTVLNAKRLGLESRPTQKSAPKKSVNKKATVKGGSKKGAAVKR